MRSERKCKGNRHGVVLIWVALIVLVLVAFIGLAIDVAWGFVVANELQNAADAGALAGADEVIFNSAQAVTDATNTATANTAAGVAVQVSGSDIQVGNCSNGAFTAGGAPANAVEVTVRRTSGSPGGPLNLLFGPIFGVNTVDVSRSAIAQNDPLNGGLIVLSQTASPAIQLTGTGSNPDKIVVNNGGAVVVDSTSSTAVQWTGNPQIEAGQVNVAGNDTALQSGGVVTGTTNINASPVTDPLASVAPPSKTGLTDRTALSAGSQPAGGWPPGIYSNGLPAGTLGGGVYYVDQGSAKDAINLSGSQTIDATAGCLIYLRTGGITMGGNSTISFNPMTTGPYAGISFWEDRSDTSPVTLHGTTGANNGGLLYFPDAQVTIAGTPNTAGSQLICSSLVVQGTAQLNLSDVGAFPSFRHSAYLVK